MNGFLLSFARSSLALLLLSVSAGWSIAAETANVMLIGGQNNHNWKKSNPYLNHIMGSHEKIDCTIENTPTNGNPDDWDAWDPQFSDYDVVVLNYNGREWPDRIKTRFIRYIRNGGNAILIHASNNAFTGWNEYEEMVGLLWRSPDYGPSIYLNDHGEQVRLPTGKGTMGHGGIFDWVMTTRDRSHPIAKGMPRHWMHARDELYHGQRGPGKDLHILFSAYSDPKHGGTGRHEPIVWWVPYGKGKVITNLMGHVGEMQCLQCVGFQTILQRSCLWLARITIDADVPDNFPIASQTSVVEMSESVAAAIEESRVKRIDELIEPREEGMSGLVSGLNFAVFSGSWGSLPDFAGLTAEATGTTDDITLQVTEKADHFAIQFTGFLMIQEAGDYAFYTKSDDGSRLLLNGITIVDNDGVHGENEEGGRVHLAAGVYTLEIQYFEASGGEALTASFSGPESPKGLIPSNILYHAK